MKSYYPIVWFILVVVASFLFGVAAASPDCVEDEYWHVQSNRCVHIDEILEGVH